jgi:hypothetical protein
MRQRRDGLWYYEVNNFTAILENVIPFFKKFHFLSAKKKRDFAKFCQIAQLIFEGAHQTPEGIEKILAIRREMNDGGKRRYTEEEIRARLKESSETIRRAPHKGDDMVRSP